MKRAPPAAELARLDLEFVERRALDAACELHDPQRHLLAVVEALDDAKLDALDLGGLKLLDGVLLLLLAGAAADVGVEPVPRGQLLVAELVGALAADKLRELRVGFGIGERLFSAPRVPGGSSPAARRSTRR